MSNPAQPNLGQADVSSQAVQANPATDEPTIQEIEDWGREDLLQWILKKKPKLLGDDGILEEFKKAYIDGHAFLKYAGDETFFRDICKLPPGTIVHLASLAEEIREKSKSIIIPSLGDSE